MVQEMVEQVQLHFLRGPQRLGLEFLATLQAAAAVPHLMGEQEELVELVAVVEEL
jgi:hypothetical protein